MGRNEQTKSKQQMNKHKKLQVQEQQNFSLRLSSGVTLPAFSPGVGI
jgi:hypothetical protein